MPFIRTILRGTRFRLATLLIGVAVISIPLAAWSSRERNYRAQLAAVRILERSGNWSVFLQGDEHDPDPHNGNLLFDDQEMLRRGDVVVAIFGHSGTSEVEVPLVPRFRGLRWLVLERCDVSNGQLAEIAKLPDLEKLCLKESLISDEGVGHLGALRSLRQLDLEGTRITAASFTSFASSDLEELLLSGTELTDEGVRRLRALRSLRELDISHTSITGVGFGGPSPLPALEKLRAVRTCITDEGARHLATLPSLRVLNLIGTKISGAALQHLAMIMRLEELYLDETEIGDSSLRRLARLPNLKSLGLARTCVTDEGLKTLAGFQSLRSLELGECDISDAGLVHLARMKSLRRVDLNWAKSVTAAGIARLKGSKPELDIVWSQRPESVRSKK